MFPNFGRLLSSLEVDIRDKTVLKYSPPSYHSFGLPPNQEDPFESNTVRVGRSGMLGGGEGLFTTR